METLAQGHQEHAPMTDFQRMISVMAGSFLISRLMKRNKVGTLLALTGGYLLYRGTTGRRPVEDAVKTVFAAGHQVNIRTGLVINKPKAEVYAAWRRLEDIPFFLRHLEKVEQKEGNRSSWSLKTPMDIGSVKWEAEIVHEEEGKELSWKSLPGSAVDNAGKLNFADTPAGGTKMDVLITYKPPLGVLGEKAARLLSPVFAEAVRKDIQGFKEYMENRSALSN
jgi:uncharacterized membrane protein